VAPQGTSVGLEEAVDVPVAFARTLRVPRAAGKAAMLRFDEVCGRGSGVSDFYALARRFDVLFVRDVPPLTPKQEDSARRFIALVDVAYDEGLALVLSAPLTESIGQVFAQLRDGSLGGGVVSRPHKAAAAEPGASIPPVPAQGELRWMISRCESRLSEMTKRQRSCDNAID